MNVFDILGPVMIGPSSSHTAGAARIGLMTRALLGKTPVKAHIFLHGSFAKTYKGHGTDKALVAGILGMQTDDYQIADSYEIAAQRGMEVAFGEARLEEAHPNTAVICLNGISGKQTEVQISSIGGSRISIDKIDGINTGFSGECPTLIVHNIDQPGCIVAVTSMLAKKNVNIATMQVYRSAKGQQAVMVVECDQLIPEDGIVWLAGVEGVQKVTYFPGLTA